MRTIIKWPGGKTREIEKINHLIPSFDRYIEPFFGGGAVYFHLKPQKAYINDLSTMLVDFYNLIKIQDTDLLNYLHAYNKSFQSLMQNIEQNYPELIECYKTNDKIQTKKFIDKIITSSHFDNSLVLNLEEYIKKIELNVEDKFSRTHKNNEKKAFSEEDLCDNLKTGFTSGFYMYFRDIYNEISMGRLKKDKAYEVANFYFIREYCYGSMFRYNSKGEFNIPYGGISYNNKSLINKIENMFNVEIENLFKETNIYNEDFEKFILDINLNENDFIFLDPPYDTEFSDYDGNSFTKDDQKRLANLLEKTKAKFILIIKNTDFIFSLYDKKFKILSFDKNYTYNVRSRNDRDVEHLIITNIQD